MNTMETWVIAIQVIFMPSCDCEGCSEHTIEEVGEERVLCVEVAPARRWQDFKEKLFVITNPQGTKEKWRPKDGFYGSQEDAYEAYHERLGYTAKGREEGL